MDKFSWGIADRGASIRVPLSTATNWTGYLEDRRPGSNADPYRIVKVILDSLRFAEELMTMKNHMSDYNTNDLNEKFGSLSCEELLNEYQNDEEYELTSEMMESKANTKPEEIKFNLNGK